MLYPQNHLTSSLSPSERWRYTHALPIMPSSGCSSETRAHLTPTWCSLLPCSCSRNLRQLTQTLSLCSRGCLPAQARPLPTDSTVSLWWPQALASRPRSWKAESLSSAHTGRLKTQTHTPELLTGTRPSQMCLLR